MNVESALPKRPPRPPLRASGARADSDSTSRLRTRTRIHVIDSRGIMRDALCALLGATEEFEVMGVESNRLQALRGASSGTMPDVVLADFPQMTPGGPEVITSVKARFPGVRIVVLTANDQDHVIKAALHAGADGYLLKSDSCNELFIALRSVVAGKGFISASIRDAITSGAARSHELDPSRTSPSAELTDREREVIRLIAAGHRTREIATILSLSHKTIEKHRSSLMRKLGLRNASAVTAYAIAHGLA